MAPNSSDTCFRVCQCFRVFALYICYFATSSILQLIAMWFKVQGSRFKVQKGKQIEEASNLLVIAKTGVLSCKRREAHQQEFKKYIKSMTTLTFLMSMSEHLRLLPPRARQEVARLAATTSAAVRVQEIQHEQLFPP